MLGKKLKLSELRAALICQKTEHLPGDSRKPPSDCLRKSEGHLFKMTQLFTFSLCPSFPGLPLQEHLDAVFNISFWTATGTSGGWVWTGGSGD